MDRRDLESGARLHEGQSRLQALLCRDVRGTVSRRQGASLRAGVRFALGSGETDGAISLAFAEAGLCELDERSISGWCARRLHRGRLQSDGQSNWHTFQVLTKRSERLRELLSERLRFAAEQDHIWWGVSVEDQKYGLPRIRDLQKAPARVRFLSIEPLLEDLGGFNLSGISWAIVGGESGPGARSMRKEWVVSVRDLCRASRVPFFFIQWGGGRE